MGLERYVQKTQSKQGCLKEEHETITIRTTTTSKNKGNDYTTTTNKPPTKTIKNNKQ